MKFKKLIVFLLTLVLFVSCGAAPAETAATEILLSDGGVLVNGKAAPADPSAAVHTAGDIVYYEADKDFTYGEGSEKDAHSADEAAAHTVVHISQPGTYSLSGKLSRGQIAVDLGDSAKDDPEAVVTLILSGAEINCDVAPAIIFYNVYECGSKDEKTASKDADTSAAGANIIIADGTQNIVSGSYVADIYDPASLVFNEDKTEVEDAKKLHSYDGAVYSCMSMNISGGGALSIDAENEGLCSELHLTVSGGDIEIFSGNDGVNANEDNLSVITVNAGSLLVQVTGETGEGDGIDSNGWLVINGGDVRAYSCSGSGDAGVDADKGVHINGGTVIASGHMFDRIEDGGQNYAVFSFAQEQKAGESLTLKGESGFVSEIIPQNDYSILIYSSSDLAEDAYTLWSGETRLSGSSGGMSMGMPGMMPGGGFMQRPDDMPGFGETPDFKNRPELPEGMPAADMPEPPEGMPSEDMPEPQDGEWKKGRGFNFRGGAEAAGELSDQFQIRTGANQFGGITPAE